MDPGEPIDQDLLEELVVDEVVAQQDRKEFVCVRPSSATEGNSGVLSRIGNTIKRDGVVCGTMSYLLRWEPASFAANCKIHEGCYVTAAMTAVDESELEEWLAKASRFYSAEDHIAAKPLAAYNKRRL